MSVTSRNVGGCRADSRRSCGTTPGRTGARDRARTCDVVGRIGRAPRVIEPAPRRGSEPGTCPSCGRHPTWESLIETGEERWLAVCRCGRMQAYLPELPGLEPEDPLRVFLIGQGRPSSPRARRGFDFSWRASSDRTPFVGASATRLPRLRRVGELRVAGVPARRRVRDLHAVPRLRVRERVLLEGRARALRRRRSEGRTWAPPCAGRATPPRLPSPAALAASARRLARRPVGAGVSDPDLPFRRAAHGGDPALDSLSVGQWYDRSVPRDQWEERERNALMDRVWAVQKRRRVELNELHGLLREVRRRRSDSARSTRPSVGTAECSLCSDSPSTTSRPPSGRRSGRWQTAGTRRLSPSQVPSSSPSCSGPQR